MMKRSVRVLLLVVAVVVLAACGNRAAPAAPAADGGAGAAAGKALFQQSTIGKSNGAGCATCHSVEPGTKIVGPSLAGLATDAAGAFKESGYKGTAKSAAEWLHEQIVNPELEMVEGFPSGVMPANYGTDLTQQQLDDIVAYLMTLK
jgi:cytochrome c2